MLSLNPITWSLAPAVHLLLSAQLADPWERAKDMLLQGTVVDGVITGFNKGGVLVELGDLKGKSGRPAAQQQQSSRLRAGVEAQSVA